MAAASAALALVTRRVAFLAAAALCALLLASTFRLAWVPLWIPLALTSLAILAAARPSEALLIVAALTPVAQYAGSRWNGAVNWPEAMVVAFAAGWALHRALRPPGAARERLARPAGIFAAVVIAGVLVEMAVVQMRLGGSGLSRALWEHLTREYFFNSRAFPALHTGALLLEGLALLVAASEAASAILSFRLRCASMLVLGAAAAGAVNILRLAEVTMRAQDPGSALLRLIATQRINVHHGDLNAAGSHFAMAVFVAAALAVTGGRARGAWGAAAVLLTFTLWISGSRAALLCAAAAAALVPLVRSRVPLRRSAVAAVTTVVLLAGGALLVAYAPMRGNQRGITAAIDTRTGLAMTSVRMLRENPLFGIGLGQFYERSGEFSSSELLQLFPAAVHENAHNNYLQIMAEQGLLGLGAFLWTLGAALLPALRRLRSEPNDLALGCAAGAAAFLLTCLAGHPLLIPPPAYAFWILLGVVAAAGGVTETRGGRRTVIAAVAVLLVLASVVPRASAQRGEADLEHVGIGVSGWHMSDDGVRYRWAERSATVFVPGRMNGFVVRLRSERAPAQVELLLDGRPANIIRVTSDRWAEVRMLLPRSGDAPRYRRLDVRVVATEGDGARLMIGRVDPF